MYYMRTKSIQYHGMRMCTSFSYSEVVSEPEKSGVHRISDCLCTFLLASQTPFNHPSPSSQVTALHTRVVFSQSVSLSLKKFWDLFLKCREQFTNRSTLDSVTLDAVLDVQLKCSKCQIYSIMYFEDHPY